MNQHQVYSIDLKRMINLQAARFNRNRFGGKRSKISVASFGKQRNAFRITYNLKWACLASGLSNILV